MYKFNLNALKQKVDKLFHIRVPKEENKNRLERKIIANIEAVEVGFEVGALVLEGIEIRLAGITRPPR